MSRHPYPHFSKSRSVNFRVTETDPDLLIFVYAKIKGIKGRELPMGGRETKRSLLQTASLHRKSQGWISLATMQNLFTPIALQFPA
jgi:hypothetical protein